jgi:hypothetical protein
MENPKQEPHGETAKDKDNQQQTKTMKQPNDTTVRRKSGILNQAIRRPHKDRRILLSVLFSFSMVAFKRWDGLVLRCLDPSSIYRCPTFLVALRFSD